MQNKTVFINGGSRGIGAAMVRLFAKEGYRVAFSYLSSHESACALANECGALAIRADTASREDVFHAVERACGAFGKIDVLINNAAVSVTKLYTDVTEEEWERILAVNLKGPMYYIDAVLPRMISEKAGKIINISSMWGQVGASMEVHYSTVKAALIGLTKSLAKEVGPSGITVNAIAPGVIATDMNGHLSEEELASLADETPLCRIGMPEDVAGTALFLASPAADFMTGQVLSPNGGFVI